MIRSSLLCYYAFRKERQIVIIVRRQRHREPRFYKPNMANLHGRIGRSILETICNTPKPDRAELNKAVAEFERTYDEDQHQRSLHS